VLLEHEAQHELYLPREARPGVRRSIVVIIIEVVAWTVLRRCYRRVKEMLHFGELFILISPGCQARCQASAGLLGRSH
jgi:hypothetical protein